MQLGEWNDNQSHMIHLPHPVHSFTINDGNKDRRIGVSDSICFYGALAFTIVLFRLSTLRYTANFLPKRQQSGKVYSRKKLWRRLVIQQKYDLMATPVLGFVRPVLVLYLSQVLTEIKLLESRCSGCVPVGTPRISN